MYVCMYVSYVCMYGHCSYVCMHVKLRMYRMYRTVPSNVKRMYVCMYVMYVCMYVCMPRMYVVCMYVCMRMYDYVCMYAAYVCM